MSIKDFEKKYNINFDGCFVYDGLLRLSRAMRNMNEEQQKECCKDFMNLKI